MFVVGLTGGIGSGKSTVAQLFAEQDVPIIDADQIAREVTAPNQPAVKKIADHFENEFLINNGVLNRARLREIIFNQPTERQWLEALLHPLIRKEIEKRLQTITYPYCIVVIPLLFESDPFPFINRILVVDTPEILQIERIISRDNISFSQAHSIIEIQAERADRLSQADDVIINDGTISELIPQVKKLHEKYLKCG